MLLVCHIVGPANVLLRALHGVPRQLQKLALRASLFGVDPFPLRYHIFKQ